MSPSIHGDDMDTLAERCLNFFDSLCGSYSCHPLDVLAIYEKNGEGKNEWRS